MRIFITYIILFTLGFFSVLTVSAQSVKSTEMVKRDGQKYYVHHVVKGQTLYAISKLYSIDIDAIKSANPGIEDNGIKIGQTLFIPEKKMNKKESRKSEITLSGDTIYHKVLKQETLYALSKKYGLSIDDITRYNPAIETEGLKIGMIVRIPVIKPEVEQVVPEIYVPAEEDSLVLHEVKEGESLFSIAREYGVSTDSIQIVNDGLSGGLRVGMTIRIPKLNPEFVMEEVVVMEDSISTVEGEARFDSIKVMKIAVFLPFQLSNTEEEDMEEGILSDDNEEKSTFKIDPVSKLSLEFYHGVRAALDSLKSQGYKIAVYYYDTSNDSLLVEKLMTENDWSDYHLFIGPLYRKNFEVVARIARKYHLPIVSPVKITSRVLLGNPYIFKAYSSSPARVIDIASYMAKHYGDSVLFMVNSGLFKDRRLVELFKKYSDRFIGGPDDTIFVANVDKAYLAQLPPFVKEGDRVFIGVPSKDEPYVAQLLSRLYDFKSQQDFSGDFIVFGMEDWPKFKSIDLKFYVALNVHIPSQQYIDFSSTPVIHFVEDYREAYHTDPLSFVFRGYDITTYFVRSIYKGGSNWFRYIEDNPGEGLSLRFNFIKIGLESGYENQGGFILKYQDYELVLAR